jgi:hypothetical protein
MPAKRRPARAIALEVALEVALDLGLVEEPMVERVFGAWLIQVLTLGWAGKSGTLTSLGVRRLQQRSHKVLGL